MGEVASLMHDEQVHLDPDALAALSRNLGPVGAEAVLARAVDEISAGLDGLIEPHVTGRWSELARRARALGNVAGQVGMVALARVAGDVAVCADRCEAPALGATLARLDRVAHMSMSELWDRRGTGG